MRGPLFAHFVQYAELGSADAQVVYGALCTPLARELSVYLELEQGLGLAYFQQRANNDHFEGELVCTQNPNSFLVGRGWTRQNISLKNGW